jgi:hypothetical protein
MIYVVYREMPYLAHLHFDGKENVWRQLSTVCRGAASHVIGQYQPQRTGWHCGQCGPLLFNAARNVMTLAVSSPAAQSGSPNGRAGCESPFRPHVI